MRLPVLLCVLGCLCAAPGPVVAGADKSCTNLRQFYTGKGFTLAGVPPTEISGEFGGKIHTENTWLRALLCSQDIFYEIINKLVFSFINLLWCCFLWHHIRGFSFSWVAAGWECISCLYCNMRLYKVLIQYLVHNLFKWRVLSMQTNLHY